MSKPKDEANCVAKQKQATKNLLEENLIARLKKKKN